ncbi:hypothetical protein JTB14_020154 [Gonioctena quinquepunctata]|nr:hypothetical protein JTB14_020154 [Gonioctena quinquepunctata]
MRKKDRININGALQGEKREFWKRAIMDGFENIINNKSWNIVKIPGNRKIIRTQWVFKTKYNEYEGIERYRAKLVALGNTQMSGIEFDQKYASVVQKKTMRMLFAIAAD